MTTAAQKAQEVLDELSHRLATMPESEVQAHADRCQQTLDEYASIIKPGELDTRMATRVRRELDLANGALATFREQPGGVPSGADDLGEMLRAFAVDGTGAVGEDKNGRPILRLDAATPLTHMAAQSTTDAAGGFTVPDEVYGLETLVAEVSPLFAYIRNEVRATGRTLHMPATDASAIQAQQIAENTESADATDLVFENFSLPFGNFATDVLPISRELLEDSDVNLEVEIVSALITWMSRGLANALTDGTGSTDIQGFSESAKTTSAFTAAGAAVVTLDELIDLKNSVSERYQRGAAFSFNWATKSILQKVRIGDRSIIAEDENNPLQGYIRIGPGGQDGPDRLAPYFINPQLPTIATGVKGIWYGDWTKVRHFSTGPFELLRFDDSPYAKKRQVGFMMQSRRAGKLITAGTPLRFITQG